MKVKDLIEKLQKFDPNAELVGHDGNEFMEVYNPFLFEDDGDSCEYSDHVVIVVDR